MQTISQPSAIAIRRATRIRELNKLTRTKVRDVLRHRQQQAGIRTLYGPDNKEHLINEVLRLEGLEMDMLS